MNDIYFLTVDKLKQKCQAEYADVPWSELREMIKKADQTAFCKSLLGKTHEELNRFLEEVEMSRKSFSAAVCEHYEKDMFAAMDLNGEEYEFEKKNLDEAYKISLFCHAVLAEKMTHITEKISYPKVGWNQEGGDYPVWVDPETGMVYHYTKV